MHFADSSSPSSSSSNIAVASAVSVLIVVTMAVDIVAVSVAGFAICILLMISGTTDGMNEQTPYPASRISFSVLCGLEKTLPQPFCFSLPVYFCGLPHKKN